MKILRLLPFSLAILTGIAVAAPVGTSNLAPIPQFNSNEDVQEYVEQMQAGIVQLKDQKDNLKDTAADKTQIAETKEKLNDYRNQLQEFEQMAMDAPKNSVLGLLKDDIKGTVDELMKKGGLKAIELPPKNVAAVKDADAAEAVSEHADSVDDSGIFAGSDGPDKAIPEDLAEWTNSFKSSKLKLTPAQIQSINSLDSLDNPKIVSLASQMKQVKSNMDSIMPRYKNILQTVDGSLTKTEGIINRLLADGRPDLAMEIINRLNDGFSMLQGLQTEILDGAGLHDSFEAVAEAGQKQLAEMIEKRDGLISRIHAATDKMANDHLAKSSSEPSKGATGEKVVAEKPGPGVAAKAAEGAAADDSLKKPAQFSTELEQYNTWKKTQQEQMVAMFSPPKDGKVPTDPVQYYRDLLKSREELEDSNPRYSDNVINGIAEAQMAQESGKEWKLKVQENQQLQNIFQGVVEYENAQYMNKINDYNTKFGAWDLKTNSFANEADISKSGSETEIKNLQEAKDFMNTGKDDFLNKLYDIMDLNQYAGWLQWVIQKWRNIFGITGPSKAVIAARQAAVDAYNKKAESQARISREKGMEEDKKIAAKRQNSGPSSDNDARSEGHAVDSSAQPPSKPASDSNIESLLGEPQEQSDNSLGNLLSVDENVVNEYGLTKEASALKQVTSDQEVHNLLGQLSKYSETSLTAGQESTAQQVIDQLKSISDSHSSTVDIQKGIVLAVGSQGSDSDIAKLVEKDFPDTAQGIQATFAKSLDSSDESFLDKIKAAAEDLH